MITEACDRSLPSSVIDCIVAMSAIKSDYTEGQQCNVVQFSSDVYSQENDDPVDCGASITCYTMESGACNSVQENVRLI